MGELPKDPVMLLSVVNTNLRDYYDSLEEFCIAKDVEQSDIESKLEQIDYRYNKEQNQFI